MRYGEPLAVWWHCLWRTFSAGHGWNTSWMHVGCGLGRPMMLERYDYCRCGYRMHRYSQNFAALPDG